MRTSVELFGVLAASSWMEEDGVEDEQPITGLGELQVGGGLFYCFAAQAMQTWAAVGCFRSAEPESGLDAVDSDSNLRRQHILLCNRVP
jgi:hypothetical protein